MKTLNYRARFIELAGEINTDMPHYVVGKVVDGLNEFGRSVKGSDVLVLGVAYKPDIDDATGVTGARRDRTLPTAVRASTYSDPHIPTLEVFGESFASTPLPPNASRQPTASSS